MSQINIEIPEGHEVDLENSDLSKGKVVFKVKSGLPDRWEDLGGVSGFWVHELSTLRRGVFPAHDEYKATFATKELAQASIAIAQLSHLRAKAWGDWRPDWDDANEPKYTVVFRKSQLIESYSTVFVKFLAFPTPEIRDEFLSKYRDLIEQARPILGGGL